MNNCSTFIRLVFECLLSMCCVFAASACTDEVGDITPNAYLTKGGELRGYETTCPVMLTAPVGTTYTATILAGNDWVSLSPKQQTDVRIADMSSQKMVIYLYFSENMTNAVRTASLGVEFSSGEQFTFDISQGLYTVPGNYDKTWAELPAYVPDNDYVYLTHHASLPDGSSARNYSMCFDTELRLAQWIAYPLHTCYTTPNKGRTEAWAYDPDVPEEYQGYITLSYGTRKRDRGHICPSADRVATEEMNAQTFYSTNMMPQISSFNQGVWAQKESRVRANMCPDTLYVVTGTWSPEDDMRFITDRAGKSVCEPRYCFTVLLRTREGDTGRSISEITSADELISVGFWFENIEYDNGTQLTPEYVVSVDFIEQKTGWDFFRMLDDRIADEVKSQNQPSVWGVN